MDRDPFNLARFLDAQADVFGTAMAELGAGRKRSHWIWFVFPQMRGLGRSATADFFGIASLEEARAYLAHPVLGPRLRAASRAALAHAVSGAHALLGSPDDMKLRSSMTLFAQAAGADDGLFRDVLRALYGGEEDAATLRLLEGA
ncbi:DUF1810 domain-containing protein [Azorhizobium doebereinerae]|uniref:DUF1810 domain-containing protein n=1 Tax=Azorhizobium doebereinerae TaxID=281091 RepID=UPI0004065806|nr:DUF1810 domain-containing protein [Azorhizobium doebereinerae]